jgi:protein TIF31
MTLCSASDTPLQSLRRLAMRSMTNPLNCTNNHPSSNNIESVIVRPSWIIPISLDRKSGGNRGKTAAVGHQNGHHNMSKLSCTAFFDSLHQFNLDRAEEDACNTFGLDLRSGSPRDWNEELQVAREMPTQTLQERIDRARMIHKTLTDFGEAALLGAKAIFEGSILPMNPNEQDRAHVYLHNNIFYSRAVDAGLDTFKVFSGDAAARKSASRDASCTGAVHSMDVQGLHTLATVLVDYLGTRLVCQSIVPGILHGDKSHTLVYGTVETSSRLQSDSEMHELVEKYIGETFMIASRPVLVLPLSEKRMEAFASWKKAVSIPGLSQVKKSTPHEEKSDEVKNETIVMCGPLEVKGIKGSDQRKYLLDVTRLTPRDANWVPLSTGGTGHWERLLHTGELDRKISKKRQKYIPATLDDDEWTMAVLRRELVALFAQDKMARWLKAKKERVHRDLKETPNGNGQDLKSPISGDGEVSVSASRGEKEEDGKGETSAVDSNHEKCVDEDDEKYFSSLRFNVNVFLPFTRSLQHIDESAYLQFMADEEHAREAANFLWEKALPLVTQEIRESSG